MDLKITHIDTACMLIEINGYKILTDPVLDESGKTYYHGFGAFSKKVSNPEIKNIDLNNIDLILLSHHQHHDNFDKKGRAFALKVPLILSTKQASKVLKNAIGLDNFESKTIETEKVRGLKITATPAQHRPWWIPEFISGKVIGFIIEFDSQKNGALYISGDTVYFKGIEEISKRFSIDLGFFHVGSVQFRYLTGLGKYTMDSNDLLKFVEILNPNTVVPIHHKGWTHFKESEKSLVKTIQNTALLSNKTVFLKSGIPHTFS